MDKRLATINIVFAIVDTLISGMAIAAFGWGAYHFNRWWILLFMMLPLFLFNTHTLVVDADLGGDEKDGGKCN